MFEEKFVDDFGQVLSKKIGQMDIFLILFVFVSSGGRRVYGLSPRRHVYQRCSTVVYF